MKKYWQLIALLLSINCLLFLLACKGKKVKAEEPLIENPKPIQDVKTDSLKRVLDAEREQRLNR